MSAPVRTGLDAATTPEPSGALEVGGAWTGFGGAHGGLLVAAAARSMDQVVEEGRPLRTIHVDLQGAVAPGLLELHPALERAGRAVSFARTQGRQAGRTRFTASGVYGDAGAATYAPHGRGRMPDVPAVADCPAWEVEPGSPALSTVEFRPATAILPLGGDGPAEFHCWIRVAGDDTPVDRTRALTLLDAPAPGLYATVTEAFPIPTVELTAHLLPALEHARSPWVLARMQTVVAAEGYAVDDCELWTPGGALVALARQTRRAIEL